MFAIAYVVPLMIARVVDMCTLELTRFREYFPLGGERSTHGTQTPLVPAGVPA